MEDTDEITGRRNGMNKRRRVLLSADNAGYSQLSDMVRVRKVAWFMQTIR